MQNTPDLVAPGSGAPRHLWLSRSQITGNCKWCSMTLRRTWTLPWPRRCTLFGCSQPLSGLLRQSIVLVISKRDRFRAWNSLKLWGVKKEGITRFCWQRTLKLPCSLINESGLQNIREWSQLSSASYAHLHVQAHKQVPYVALQSEWAVFQGDLRRRGIEMSLRIPVHAFLLMPRTRPINEKGTTGVQLSRRTRKAW
jgi:hypothetical protein